MHVLFAYIQIYIIWFSIYAYTCIQYNLKPNFQLVICQIHEDGFRCTYSDDLETLPMPALNSRQQSPYLQLIVVHTVRESAPIK
jgi:hypothetical protein